MNKLEKLKSERESIIKEIKRIRFEQSVDIKMRMNELERKMGELSRQIMIENEILLGQIRKEEYDKKFEKRIDMDISGTARILEERKKKQEIQEFEEWKKIREEEKLKQEFEEFKKFKQRQEEKKPITESEPSIQDRKEYKTVIQKPLKIYEEKPEENIHESQESSGEKMELKPFFEKYQEYLETTSESDKEEEILKSLQDLKMNTSTSGTKPVKEEDDGKVEDLPYTEEIPEYQHQKAPPYEQESEPEENPSWYREKIRIKNRYKDKYILKEPKYFGTQKYEPRDNPMEGVNPAGIHLDLDCETNMKEKVSQWIKENLAVITKENMNIRQAVTFMQQTARGSVGWYLSYLDPELKERIIGATDVKDALVKLEQTICTEFMGIPLTQTEEQFQAQQREEAKKKIRTLEICNPYYLEKYLCQFMIIFYQGLFGDSISEEYQIYANMVFEKINPWGKV